MALTTPLSSLQIGRICQIIANHTGHHFPIGKLVVLIAVEPGSIQAVSATQGSDYISSQCFFVVGSIVLSEEVGVPIAQQKLKNWLERNKLSVNSGLQPFMGKEATTQKARGLQALTAAGYLLDLSTRIWLIQAQKDFLLKDACLTIFDFPIMARPCPVTPRHGFVESRPVHNTSELAAIIEETYQHDPNGEVIVMPIITGDWSTVTTDSVITIGKGHDAATAGKSAISIPCNSNIRNWVTTRLAHIRIDGKDIHTLKYAGINPTDGVFLETVDTYAVQLRTGPQINGSLTRWSSHPVVAVAVVFEPTPHIDFLEYEKQLEELAAKCVGPLHSIVVHIPFGSLVSHFAVQAICRGFSVVAGEEISIKPDDKLEFPLSLVSPLVYTSQFVAMAQRGIKVGMAQKITERTLMWAVAVIQGIGSAEKTPHSVGLLVAAGVIIARAGTAFCLGEHRHFYHQGPGKQGIQAVAPIGFPLTAAKCDDRLSKPHRETVYAAALRINLTNMRTFYHILGLLNGVEQDFKISPWSGGFGGIKWAFCTQATQDILVALLPFLSLRKSPESMNTSLNPLFYNLPYAQKHISDLVAAANRLINQSHNTGKCLTKVISQLTLLNISNGATGPIIATSPLTWEIVK